MEAVIYLVTHRATGRRYVGVTRFTIEKRWAQHIGNSRRAPRTYLQRSIAKYGADAFDVIQVASCLSDSAQVEKDVIATLQPEFNQTSGGEFTKGRRITKEIANRIADSNRGKKRTAEQKYALSLLKKAEMADPERRAHAGAVLKAARLLIDEEKRRAAAAISAKTRVWSEASRAKLSASCMGRRYGKEVIDRMRATKNKMVECVTLNCTFDSVSDAASGLGVGISSVSKACIGKHKTAGGMTFRFV